jgi:hypothetical protein
MCLPSGGGVRTAAEQSRAENPSELCNIYRQFGKLGNLCGNEKWVQVQDYLRMDRMWSQTVNWDKRS